MSNWLNSKSEFTILDDKLIVPFKIGKILLSVTTTPKALCRVAAVLCYIGLYWEVAAPWMCTTRQYICRGPMTYQTGVCLYDTHRATDQTEQAMSARRARRSQPGSRDLLYAVVIYPKLIKTARFLLYLWNSQPLSTEDDTISYIIYIIYTY